MQPFGEDFHHNEENSWAIEAPLDWEGIYLWTYKEPNQITILYTYYLEWKSNPLPQSQPFIYFHYIFSKQAKEPNCLSFSLQNELVIQKIILVLIMSSFIANSSLMIAPLIVLS